MEGCYRVEENVNFENFLKVMGVPDDETIQKMIQATTQVTLTANADGTWTQVSGLKTSTFPVDKEFTDAWGDKELTGFVKLDGTTMTKVFKLGDVEVFSEEVVLSGTCLTLTLVARDGTKAVRKMVRV
eukprot:TRINITY_DN11502_c0_g1_i1.p1 TRINITY_DN11502_c0_g1~~TRINITY_DN11502_c0_g1_i1.p1  ORF type:complete len:128 (-),score=33.69 TRINITY_DN11502_c0_g1_i1:93-476(-)